MKKGEQTVRVANRLSVISNLILFELIYAKDINQYEHNKKHDLFLENKLFFFNRSGVKFQWKFQNF